MKRKLASVLLVVSVLFGSHNIFAAETTNDPIHNMSEQINEQIYNEHEQVIEDSGIDLEDSLSFQTTEINLTLGSNAAKVNGEVYTLLSPPKVIKGRTFLPLRFVVDQVLGAEVVWHNETREVSVTKGQKIVVVQIGAVTATINGEKVTLDQPPIIENDITLLPIRFMSETFGLTTEFNEIDRTIRLISIVQSSGEEIKPVAQFSFDQEFYIAGQAVKSIDTSYDLTGSSIVEKIWMINDDPKLNAPKLENMFKTPRAGSYKIALRVRNNRGVWSEWAEQIVFIAPNEKPVVTHLAVHKDAYAQGENIAFTYEYENEAWEKIQSERWTYRRLDQPSSKATIDKPKALFAEGEYVITLELQDAYGNMSDKKELIIHITEKVLRSELEYRFTEGSIGDIIDNFKSVNYQSYQEVFPYDQSVLQGTLMMSDSPEVVKREGILYRDSIIGNGRILLHHINDFQSTENTLDNKRLVLVAENTTDQPVKMIIQNKTVKGPSEDSLFIGQVLLQDYLRGSAFEEHTLNPGEKKYIYDSISRRWLKGQCISGLMDILTDGKITFTAAAIGEKTTIDMIVNMPLLEKDTHPRGTFDTTNIYYKINLEQGSAQKLLIGRGTTDWVNGYDAITGEMVQNRGNFGVSYHITITAGEDMGIILNPRADIFRGAIKWQDGGTHLMPAKGFFAGETTKSAVLGTIKAGQTRTFEYMLPNGSSAPVLIGFIPKSEWSK
ncbi:copper amine oxidase N-terminal domain-containing protein [Cellulosilyticum sp. I15G10I2]|uniref:copper amine oxidase N-terminal domain-containing protein n=1 Tax=Cellulosilyticum sp. I15G10I2 TaxID=1892843 RepID=UPI00085C2C39|nr:copper amine oxidase N-terminal domain-containing protein [Cellulosilyticum sp. I15G10I2]